MDALYWDSGYEIVLCLKERFPDADLEDVSYGQLYEWIIALPGFADDPNLVNEGILRDILREWYEEVSG
ncbi:Fe-S cluster assembly protein IscX [Kamptonema cortianum]|nr:Fe-S cluster assembly protein IscX [Geitlerinema splendidum]MDK3160600.1 Fe-S cluster assembly protein IscX [Kamptonema cortianum]